MQVNNLMAIHISWI